MTEEFKPWRCGKCGKVYSYDEFFNLTRGDRRKHCECGYIFTHDAWSMVDSVTAKIEGFGTVIFKVSTIYLELISCDDELYETMIFPEDERCYLHYNPRYKTEEEARKGHALAITLIKSSKINIKTEDDGDCALTLECDGSPK